MKIRMPQLGESVVEGTISRWLKHEGDQVEQYEPLLEIITDKVNAEYPSPASGTLRKILVQDGETVDVNVEIAEMELTGDQAEVEASVQAVKEEPVTTVSISAPDSGPPQVGTQPQPASVAKRDDRDDSGHRYSPAVRRLAEEHSLDLKMISGTGSGGRVTRKDVERYIESHKETRKPQPEPGTMAQHGMERPLAPLRAAPTPEPGDQLLTLDPMRRAIAEHMVRSAYTSPHVTTVMEVDMTSIVRYRERVKDSFQSRENIPLTYLPFVVKSVVDALKENPRLNSYWSDEGIILKKNINIGVAVGMENGLLVPVIHEADSLSLVGIARAIADLSVRARDGKLSPMDVQGGTFTVNNPGTFGTLVSTPIIVQPQAGILSTEAITKRPVVIDDAIAIRSIMYMSLSFDHRILDGMQAARFLQSVKQRLENFDLASAGL